MITPKTGTLKNQEMKAKNPDEKDSEEPSEAISHGKEDRALEYSQNNHEVNQRASLKQSNVMSKQDQTNRDNVQ